MVIIEAMKRVKFGTSLSRNLRLKNKIPAIVYGCKKYNFGIELDHDLFLNFLKKKKIYKKNITLLVDSKNYLVKIKELHWHVFKPKILHIDFIFVM